MKLSSPFQHPALWILLFATWFVSLWILSSGQMPELPSNSLFQVDKIYHFGYFFGGSGIFNAAVYSLSRGKILPHMLLTTSVIALTATGALDEWHQSTVYGRSGNDAMDLTADFLGSVAGFHVFQRFRFLFDRKASSTK